MREELNIVIIIIIICNPGYINFADMKEHKLLFIKKKKLNLSKIE